MFKNSNLLDISTATIVATLICVYGIAAAKNLATQNQGASVARTVECLQRVNTTSTLCAVGEQSALEKIEVGLTLAGAVASNDCISFVQGFTREYRAMYSVTLFRNDTVLKTANAMEHSLTACALTHGNLTYRLHMSTELG